MAGLYAIYCNLRASYILSGELMFSTTREVIVRIQIVWIFLRNIDTFLLVSVVF